MRHLLATILLGPVLLWQGKAVRRQVPLLPEPPGERHGRRGGGPLLRLLVVGDSAAAGVGASHQDEALLGRLVQDLEPHVTVEWTLCARTGATTVSTLERLARLEGGPFDVAVVSLGVNDITAGLGLGAWLERQATLRRVLREDHGVSGLVVSGLPPVQRFPALPQPLRWYLGARAREFDRALRRAVADEPDVAFVGLDVTEDPAAMASDGFHPGPPVYREWGRRAAEAALALRARDRGGVRDD